VNRQELIAKVKAMVEENFDVFRKMREHLHAHPELSYQEHETAAFVAKQLTTWGISFQSGVAGTGIVALIEGNQSGKTIALRADLDALPIHEENEVPYASKNSGVMHACGHDVHTTSLLGTAYVLYNLRSSFAGTVKLIFQPGEEKLPGGASLMIAEGVLENPAPEKMYAQHVFPELPAGKVGFREGRYMASCDELHVTVNGIGGHGAMPHKTIDPVLIASHMVVALQQMVSRRVNPEIPCVLSFGRFIAEGATNVIPNKVQLEGTFRTFNEDWRKEAHQLMKKMAEELAASMGGTCDFRIDKGYPFLVNDAATTQDAKARAQEFLGKENVVDLPIRMTAEDFAYFSQQKPACFYRLGVANEAKGIVHPVHNSRFDIDPAALKTGVGLLSWIALAELMD